MRKVCMILTLCLYFGEANGQFSVVLIDSLTDGIRFTDNNLLCVPDKKFGYDEPIPAFHIIEKTDDHGLTFPAISLTDSVVKNTWMTGAFNTMDYYFPEIVRNPGDTLKIEFDLIVETIRGSGEAGRINVSLLASASGSGPFNGITFPLAPGFEQPPVHFNDWSDYTGGIWKNGTFGSTNSFGAPTYHLWLFTGNYGPALSYGGSYPRWPGWNPGAGGYYYNRNAGAPETAVDYNTTDNYPLVPYSKKQPGVPNVSATQWKHYTWLITDQMIRLYWRNTDQGPEDDEEIIFMAIPRNEWDVSFINEAHGTHASEMPPEYKWYERMSALRVYHTQNNRNMYLSNISFTKTGTPVSTYAEFQGLSATRRRIRADADGYNLPVLLYNGTDGVATTVTLELIKGDAGHINGFTNTTITFPEITGGEMTVETVPLTLTDMYHSENDTLVFKLSDIQGGYHPTFGANRTFELVVRPSGTTPPTGITQDCLQDLRVFPNPASNYLRIENIPVGQQVTVEIFDHIGRLAYQNNYRPADQLDISGIRNGVYFIRITSNDASVIINFIKH